MGNEEKMNGSKTRVRRAATRRRERIPHFSKTAIDTAARSPTLTLCRGV